MHRAAPPPLGTNWTRRVPHPVLIGHAASPAPGVLCRFLPGAGPAGTAHPVESSFGGPCFHDCLSRQAMVMNGLVKALFPNSTASRAARKVAVVSQHRCIRPSALARRWVWSACGISSTGERGLVSCTLKQASLPLAGSTSQSRTPSLMATSPKSSFKCGPRPKSRWPSIGA